MADLPLPLTLRRHEESLKIEASSIQPIKVHSCKHCAQLLVKLPDVYLGPDRGDYDDPAYAIKGLSPSAMLNAARDGCLIFDKWLQELQEENVIEDLEANGLFLQIGLDYSSAWSNYESYPRKKAYYAYVIGGSPKYSSANLVRDEVYHLSIGEDSIVPHWLRDHRIWRSSPATEEAFRAARGWLEQCHQHSLQAIPEGTINLHKNCKPLPNTFVPSRLICIPQYEETSLQIIETMGVHVPWCSLSYCWGGSQTMQTTSDNFTDGKRTIRMSELPQTIMDAVLVARKLEIGHLWVDSLCIIQDDPKDMQEELVNMAKVYEQSVVTLVAASASTVDGGFLGPRNLSNT